MTPIDVLIGNGQVLAGHTGAGIIGIWATIYFIIQLRSAHREPAKLAIAGAVIAMAAAVYAMIPSLLSAGSDTGQIVTGGGGAYSSMQAPSERLAMNDGVDFDARSAAA